MRTTEQHYIGKVNELADLYGMPYSTAGGKLLALCNAGLMLREKRGRNYYYKFPKAWEAIFKQTDTPQIVAEVRKFMLMDKSEPLPALLTPPLDTEATLRNLPAILRDMAAHNRDLEAKFDKALAAVDEKVATLDKELAALNAELKNNASFYDKLASKQNSRIESLKLLMEEKNRQYNTWMRFYAYTFIALGLFLAISAYLR